MGNNNVYDLLENVRRKIDPEVLIEIEAVRPEQLWGAEVCLLASEEPITILALAGQTPTLVQNSFFPPRLVAVKDKGDRIEVLGDNSEVGRLLKGAFEETERVGKLNDRASIADINRIVADLSGSLSQLTHWDVRPARTVALPSSLAEFLPGEDVGDEGYALMGNLSLSAMEKLCEAWAGELDPSWIEV